MNMVAFLSQQLRYLPWDPSRIGTFLSYVMPNLRRAHEVGTKYYVDPAVDGEYTVDRWYQSDQVYIAGHGGKKPVWPVQPRPSWWVHTCIDRRTLTSGEDGMTTKWQRTHTLRITAAIKNFLACTERRNVETPRRQQNSRRFRAL